MSRKKAGAAETFPLVPGKMLEPDFWRGRGRYSKTASKQRPAGAAAVPLGGAPVAVLLFSSAKRQRLERWIKEQD